MINTVLIRKGACAAAGVINSFTASGAILSWNTSDASTVTITPVSNGTNIGSVAASGSYTLTRPISTGTSRTDVYILTVDGTLTASASVYWAQTCTVVCLGSWEGECIVYSTCP